MIFPLKRLALAAAALVAVAGAAAPAQADHGRWGKGYDRGPVERYVERREVRRYHGPRRHHARRWKHGHRHHGHGPRRVIHTERTVHIHRYEPPRRHVHRHREVHNHSYNFGSVDKSTGGTIIGALLGAAVGTQIGKGSGNTAAILGGAAIGGILGHEIGQSMEEADRRQVHNALERAPTGQTVAWRNPDTGSQYAVTPTRTYRSAANLDCREYKTWVFIDGYEEEVTGTACRSSDGRWQPVQG
ncbi:MAG: glycine zipper 2TM domain-containing protein [Alphaproteobacteria bacterium]|nr:glycine zipper 2TM domain-containing protein [Alphaproteobacteria bacterium]